MQCAREFFLDLEIFIVTKGTKGEIKTKQLKKIHQLIRAVGRGSLISSKGCRQWSKSIVRPEKKVRFAQFETFKIGEFIFDPRKPKSLMPFCWARGTNTPLYKFARPHHRRGDVRRRRLSVDLTVTVNRKN
jgi:hypothetical protein